MAGSRRGSQLTDPAQRAVALMRADARSHVRRTLLCGAFSLAAIAMLLLTLGGAFGAERGRLAGFAVCLALGMLSGLSAPRGQNRAAPELARLDDPATVGHLLAGLEVATDDDRRELEAALLRLLPGVTPEHAPHWPAEAWTGLFGFLIRCDFERQTGLLVAALQALARVGDERAIPYVEALAANGAGSPAETIVRVEARELLQALRERERRRALHGTLLRPADDPTKPADTLLRPAGGPGVSDPDKLLRPRDAE